MKTRFITGFFILTMLLSFSIQGNAQDRDRPQFVAFSTTAWNMDLDDEKASPEEWTALSKEYNEKVTMKNDYIRSTSVLRHMYTADNAEVIFITTYNSWDDIEKAQDKNDELEEAAWPDKKARMAFMDKMNRYVVNKHSDEIYATTPGAKLNPDLKDTNRVVYIQKVYRAYPADGSAEEYTALSLEYAENVTQKNPHLLAYYPMQHAWGADNTEVLHVYVLNSMEDLVALNRSWDALEEAAWPDEAKRKAFFKKFDRYFNGHHGDFIYSSIPGISK